MAGQAVYSSRRGSYLLFALILAVAVLPDISSLSFGFVYDDHLAIEDNPHLKLWPGLQRILLSDVWSLSGLGKDSNYYRPMFVLAYEGISHAAGTNPRAFHLVNLVFHAATTMMVFLLTTRLWKKNSIAVMATILFAIHPTHAEPVAWVAALSELGYTFFTVLALYFYIDEKPSRWRLGLALASFIDSASFSPRKNFSTAMKCSSVVHLAGSASRATISAAMSSKGRRATSSAASARR